MPDPSPCALCLLTLIIDKHIYDGREALLVSSLQAGSKVNIHNGNKKIGEALAQGGSVVIQLNALIESKIVKKE